MFLLKFIVFFLVISVAMTVFRVLVGLYRGFSGSGLSDRRRQSVRMDKNTGNQGSRQNPAAETIELDRDQYRVE